VWVLKQYFDHPLCDLGQTNKNSKYHFWYKKKISIEKKNSFRIILTGGNCNIFKRLIENVIVSDDLFNSRGLNFIMYEYLKNEY